MTVNKRKKSSRMRGSRTYGWGIKKHRGSGNRGGFGMAGSGKRAGHKKPGLLKEYGQYLGKIGFTTPPTVKRDIRAINLEYIERNFQTLLANGAIKKENNKLVLNIKDLGYNKLLGKGNLKNKLEIVAEYASENAIEKVKKSGGNVIASKSGIKEESANDV